MAKTPTFSYKNDSDEDRGNLASKLQDREQAAYDREFGDIAKNFDDTADSDQEDDNIAKAREQEQSSNTFNYSSDSTNNTLGRGRTILRKIGPTGGIVGLIIGAVFGGSIFFSPGLLLVQIKEVLTNHGSSASRAAPDRFRESLYYRMSTSGIKQACAKPLSIKCKRGTMKDKTVKKLQAAGFDVNSERIGGRHIVTEISQRDTGISIDNSKTSLDRAFANPAFASAMNKAVNPKSLVFIGDRFSAKVLKKLGLNKSKVVLEGKDEAERKNSLNDKTGGSDTEDEKKQKLRSSLESRVTKHSIIKKTAGLEGAASVACIVYNLARVTLTTVKTNNMLKFAGFAMIFLKVADQIKANGDVDPETVATLGTVLTATAASGPTKGLSATDSQGFKLAAYGNEKGLQQWTANYMLGNNKGLEGVEGSIDFVNEKVGGKKKISGLCKGATDPVTGAAIGAIFCAAAGGQPGFIVGTILPGIGNLVGGFGGWVACNAVGILTGVLAGLAVGKVIGWLLPLITDSLSNGEIDVNKISGVDAGNALAVGAGVIMEQSNMSRGLQPGTKENVEKFQAATQESNNDYELAMRYDARKTPFDAYNQYSFLGSFIRNTGVTYSSGWSIAQLLRNTGTLAFSGVSIMPKSFAAASMPVNVTAEDLSHCQDDKLRAIGIDCDLIGGTQFTMRTDIPVKENLAYMIPKYVDDETSQPKGDYEDWVEYCTDNREDPLGLTSVPIEEETDWSTGKACVPTPKNQAMLDQFSTFYFDNAAQQDEDGEVEGTQSPGSSLTTPSGIDLSIWKLTLPDASEISRSKLQTYNNCPIFCRTPEGISFQAIFKEGGHTENSDKTRSELREMTAGDDEGDGWSNTSGLHEMTITQAILTQPKGNSGRIVAGQIHDEDDDVVKILLEGSKLYASFGLGKGNGDKNLLLDGNYKLGTKFTVKLTATGGKTIINYNGTTTQTYDRAYKGAYFKAGVYPQSEDEGDGGSVIIYGLEVRHS